MLIASRGVSGNRFDTQAFIGHALPRAQNLCARNLLSDFFIANNHSLWAAQLFDIGNGAMVVVIVGDEDYIRMEGGSANAPRIDEDKGRAFNQKATMSEPLNTL